MYPLKGKRVLITGGTGTIGSAILRRVLKYSPEIVIIFSRDEMKQYNMQNRFREYSNVFFYIGDVRDRDSLDRACKDINVVFHAAALKQVPICESFPYEATLTNIVGVQNLTDACIKNGVEKVVAISTDKAVHPVGVMGATKLIAERLIEGASVNRFNHHPVFCNARFGNVVHSRGSVIPKLVSQIRHEYSCSITEPKMTRFLMGIETAVDLIFEALGLAQGGETFIFKMKSVTLQDLVTAMVEEIAPLYGIKQQEIKILRTGIRAGEKMHEELFTAEEAQRTIELNDILIILPHGKDIQESLRDYQGSKVFAKTYSGISSESPRMTVEEIRDLLRNTNETLDALE